MNVLLLLIVAATALLLAEGKDQELRIGVKKRPETCDMRSKSGDRLSMHYTGTLEDGTEFDSSVPRNQPFEFTLGSGQVIKGEDHQSINISPGSSVLFSGWDQGLLNMCVGEKRRLQIPPHLGYGDRGAPPKIPGGATLIFEVELLKIDRK
ncbi:Peptidyl-prolyl cis-trans isomerase FKBP2 [Geodia barretti]|uniref:peptidylprolyl isomerase n=1 Tax=Geodia barretti TaxID=519541 RepID=A0AA35SFR8_GEOBA|nr:Peptidyl-prolyl cis-trans isomerase FKBP2 [Geodia barretti]